MTTPLRPAAPSAASAVSPAAAPLDLPLDLESDEAKRAVETSVDYIRKSVSGGQGVELAPKTVEKDNLGMTHVRLLRKFGTLPMQGEMLIAHLNRDGQVVGVTGRISPIPPNMFVRPPELSPTDAIQRAREMFGAATEAVPTAEKVIAKAPNGEYRLAYQVECANLALAGGPKRQNYLIDARDGSVLGQWNAIHAIKTGPAGPVTPARRRAEGSAKPRTEINTFSLANAMAAKGEVAGNPTQSSIEIKEDFRIGSIKVDLDIDHPNRSDLAVFLGSPSGVQVKLADREGRLGQKDLKTSFDLQNVLEGERAKGKWTLSVVDLQTGDVGTLNSWKISMTERDAGPFPRGGGKADDQSVFVGKVDLATTKGPDGRYQLLDRSRGLGIETRNAGNSSYGQDAKKIYDDNDVWGEPTDSPENAAAVDVQHGAQLMYDYLKGTFGRDSIDGLGKKLVSNIHWGTEAMAFWDRPGAQMNYGEGNARIGSFTTLDITGHEIMHGVVDSTAKLEYSGESGALNESFADILGGAGIEWYAFKQNPKLTEVLDPFLIAEQSATPGVDGDAERSMANPPVDGNSRDHYSKRYEGPEDNGGVHWNSGISNNAFYLLTQGGQNQTSGLEVKGGIGMGKGLQIFGRALLHYLHSTAKFSDAREATIKASTDLFGASSTETQRVKDAWSAVGVE